LAGPETIRDLERFGLVFWGDTLVRIHDWKQDKPDDYVVATGETHTVQEFLDVAFARAGLDPKKHVSFDERYLRRAEVDLLIGDASKAKKKLGWEPKVKFKQLAEIMVDADIEQLEKELEGRSVRV